MNNIFDINRFGKLVVLEFNKYKSKLMWTGVFAFGIFALTVIYAILFKSNTLDFSFHSMGNTIIILAPLIFYKGIDKVNSVYDFTLPASSFEKFFVKWSFSVLLMPVFVTFLLLIIAGLYSIMPSGIGIDSTHSILDYYKNNTFDRMLTISAFQSMFMVGTYYFRKNVFWKVFLCFLVYFFLCVVVFVVTHRYFLMDHYTYSFKLGEGGMSGIIELMDSKNSIFSFISSLTAPLGLWVVSFLKLREIEV